MKSRAVWQWHPYNDNDDDEMIILFCANLALFIINLKCRSLIEPRTSNNRALMDATSSSVGTDISICPTHNLIRRDSSDNISEASDENVYQHHSNHLSTRTRSINIQAAVIHVIGDFIQSIGVFTSAVIIKFYVSQEYVHCKRKRGWGGGG